PCRKKKAVHKSTTTDDKKLQSTLKRIGVNTIPAIEEVNIFKDDLVIQFVNPKVQASIVANTWVITGSPQTRKLQDILPGIINQLGKCLCSRFECRICVINEVGFSCRDYHSYFLSLCFDYEPMCL
ncbi:unnamed protein product, partial [Linum tenue]